MVSPSDRNTVERAPAWSDDAEDTASAGSAALRSGADGGRARPRPRAVKLHAEDVSIVYRGRNQPAFLAVDGLTLDIYENEFVSIVGPSGCGKTSLLNAIDGLIPINSGRLEINGDEVRKPGSDRAMVFQQPSLLPWRNVLRNVSYGAELEKRRKKDEIERRARELVEMVGLGGFESSYPLQLSGGMQQRVNLARALALDPEMLLMDEPFAALDAQTRETMQLELSRICAEAAKVTVFITHDIGEAIYLSDRVIVLSTRPGHVREIVDIDLPRPRPLELKHDPKFIQYEEQIWQLIKLPT